jgi:hypothetical protein
MLSQNCFQRTAARLAAPARSRKPKFCAVCVIGLRIREDAKTMNHKDTEIGTTLCFESLSDYSSAKTNMFVLTDRANLKRGERGERGARVYSPRTPRAPRFDGLSLQLDRERQRATYSEQSRKEGSDTV